MVRFFIVNDVKFAWKTGKISQDLIISYICFLFKSYPQICDNGWDGSKFMGIHFATTQTMQSVLALLVRLG